jgi:AcrR family transcriptional regulator
VSTVGETTPSADGRRARRERGRIAVIDAMFELLQAGKVPPSADMIAEHAGVSVASIFRYFDGLDDLQLQTFERFRSRFAPLIGVDIVGDRPARVAALVEARLDLYEQAGAIMAVGRLRALEHQPLVEAAAQTRSAMADQVRRALAAEGVGEPPGRIAALVALVDALTSLESWNVMRTTHARSREQIALAWRRSIDVLVDDWERGTDPT